MHEFTIIPAGKHRSAAITAPDGFLILPIVHGLDCDHADVMEDGRYSFSVQEGGNGVWCIYRRKNQGPVVTA